MIAVDREARDGTALESPSAARVLIVQRDADYADVVRQRLEAAGFQVVGCAGPHPPNYNCYLLTGRAPAGDAAPAHTQGHCPIVEIVDVLIYDPWLYTSKDSSDAATLLRALRRRYPSQPLVLAWPEEGLPRVGSQLMLDPGVHVGPADPDELVRFVQAIVRDKRAMRR